MEFKVKATYLARRAAGEGIRLLTEQAKEQDQKERHFQSQADLTQLGSVHSIYLANPVLHLAFSSNNFMQKK